MGPEEAPADLMLKVVANSVERSCEAARMSRKDCGSCGSG